MASRKTYNKNLDFLEFRPDLRVGAKQGKRTQETESEMEEIMLTNQRDDKNSNLRIRRRERVVAEIVQKLGEELRVDILRIIRKEVRENLRLIIGETIKEDIRTIMQEGRTLAFKKIAKETVEEDIRVRIVGFQEEVFYESESVDRERSNVKDVS